MGDYNKVSVRFSDFGLNIGHDPTTLPFGKYTRLENVVSTIEGNLKARPGQTLGNSSATGSAISGMRRLNDSVDATSKFVVRNGTSLHISDSTTAPFTLSSIATGFSNNFGSFVVYRPSISAYVWMYVFDGDKLVKTDGHGNVHPIGYTRPGSVHTTGTNDFSAAVGGAGGNLTPSSTYQYRFSLYSSTTGAESLYNLIPDGSITADISASTTATNFNINVRLPDLTLDTSNGGNFAGVDKARIYRTGGTIATWNLIGETAYTGTSVVFNDNLSDGEAGAALEQDEVSEKPFTTVNPAGASISGRPLAYAADPYLGYVLAVGDPNNPGYLYWTNKFDPDRASPDNNTEVTSPQDPLQNVVIYNGRPFVFSKESLYELFIGLSETSDFTPSKTPCSRGLFSPQAFAVGPEIYFLSKDGIYATTGGVERSLTDEGLRPLFQGTATVGSYQPIDWTQTSYLRMAYFKNEVWFQYRDTGGTVRHLIYSIIQRRWRSATFSSVPFSMYSDEEVLPNLWFGNTTGNMLYHSGTSDNGSAIPCFVETGAMVFGTPLQYKDFGNVLVDVNPAGTTVTTTALFNSQLGTPATQSVNSSSSTRTKVYLPFTSGTAAQDLQLKWSWSSSTVIPVLFGYDILYRQERPELTSWMVHGVSHGIEGWQIVRSGYFTLAADGTVILDVFVYGDSSVTSTQYTLTPSTSRSKLFVPFNPLKGKLFAYRLSLGTATNFRFFPEESEIHAKPWISTFGYSRPNPFAGSQPQLEGSIHSAAADSGQNEE